MSQLKRQLIAPFSSVDYLASRPTLGTAHEEVTSLGSSVSLKGCFYHVGKIDITRERRISEQLSACVQNILVSVIILYFCNISLAYIWQCIQ